MLIYDKRQQTEVAGENTCKFVMESVVEEAKSTNPGELDYQDGDIVLLQKDYTDLLKSIVGVNYGSK